MMRPAKILPYLPVADYLLCSFKAWMFAESNTTQQCFGFDYDTELNTSSELHLFVATTPILNYTLKWNFKAFG